MKEEKLHALIQLLDDPDEEVQQQVTAELLSMGEKVIPSLENAWEDCLNPQLQEQIEEVVHKIQFKDTVRRLKHWTQQKEPDLLEGALIITRYKFPEIELESIYESLERLERDIWIELNNNLTGFEKINVFNHVFYKIHGFTGNTDNYLHPDNCFINKVIHQQKGNPVSLGILYLIIARRLHLPIHGVNLPQHFILSYTNQGRLLSRTLFPKEEQNNILFYINPFNKGAVFTQKEIITYLKKLNINPKKPDGELNEQYFQPCDNITIIDQLLQQLKDSYQQLGYPEKEDEIRHLRAILNPQA